MQGTGREGEVMRLLEKENLSYDEKYQLEPAIISFNLVKKAFS